MEKTSPEELKKIVEHSKFILGSNEIIRKLKQGKIKKVYVASNIPKELLEDINYNAKISHAEVENLDIPNDELGILFKRTHSVLAIGILN